MADSLSNSLYRPQALAHQSRQQLGAVTLHQPLAYSLIVILVVLFTVVLIAFAWWGEYTRKERVSGYLVPDKGLLKVFAPQSGLLQSIQVKEGELVSKGQALFVINNDRGSLDNANVSAELVRQLQQQEEELQAELHKQVRINQLEQSSLQLHINGQHQALSLLVQEIATQEQRVKSAVRQLKLYKKLLSSHHVAETEVEQKNNDFLDQTIRHQALLRNRINLQNEIATQQQQYEKIILQAANTLSSIKREIYETQQSITELQSRRSIVVFAPDNGTVTSLLATSGQNVTPNLPLLSIIPQGATLQAKLLIPSRAIGFIEKDQNVALRFQAFPYQRFGSFHGTIREITRTLTAAGDTSLPGLAKEPVYMATLDLSQQQVAAYGRQFPLQSGMTFEADIWIDKRRLVEWIFDPVFSLVKKV